jgi:hypothetical protein
LVAVGCRGPTPEPTPKPTVTTGSSALKIAFFGPPSAPHLAGAQLALEELEENAPLGRGVEIDEMGEPSGASLVRTAEDPQVIGALTVEGAAAIGEAGETLDDRQLATFELADDLYEARTLRLSVFQVSTPHSWQAWRMARYFGPDDRAYKKVGLLRGTTLSGDIAAEVLAEALARRGVAFVDSMGPVREATERLRAEAPEAVVIEGFAGYIREAVAGISARHRYQGRSQIHEGWRPQVAGFESLLGALPQAIPGYVATGDYATPAGLLVLDSVRRFSGAFEKKYGKPPGNEELGGYEAVQLLGEAVRRAGNVDRARILEALEGFDRVRFGRLPVSLGPDDHLVAERDVLGLWAHPVEQGKGNARLLPLMRTFTSDLERTNILEEDWAVFFEGTMPGGEPPFYHQAKLGITTGSEDQLN